MYKIYSKILVLMSCFLLLSCVDNGTMNRNPYEPTDEDLQPDNYGVGLFFVQMQNNVIPTDQDKYQRSENLVGDEYGRYLSITNDGWSSTHSRFNASIAFRNQAFTAIFPSFYGAWFKVCALTNKEGAQFAWAKILRVAAMHRMTDKFGPIPYSQITGGSITVAYDSQQEVYNHLFEDLDSAIDYLTDFVNSNPDVKPMARYDNVYGGDYRLWVKFANSLKLRMAMRIVYADEELAKTKAEEAVAHPFGLLESNEENAYVSSAKNPIYIISHAYSDTRTCADLDSYMKGYNDPRISSYFLPSNFEDLGFYGLRAGIDIPNKEWAKKYSCPNQSQEDRRVMWMDAAEIWFLKSEGALRGWNMGGTAESLYNQGIRTSFGQYNVNGADEYIADEASTPAEYVAPNDNSLNHVAMSSITIKWDETADFEEKLERIITQKWIAMWPLGAEAWAENRRTGYPRFMPVTDNLSGDPILTNGLAKRIPFAPSEVDNNEENYAAAVALLGGADDYGTKLWWDKKN